MHTQCVYKLKRLRHGSGFYKKLKFTIILEKSDFWVDVDKFLSKYQHLFGSEKVFASTCIYEKSIDKPLGISGWLWFRQITTPPNILANGANPVNDTVVQISISYCRRAHTPSLRLHKQLYVDEHVKDRPTFLLKKEHVLGMIDMKDMLGFKKSSLGDM